MNAEWKQKSWSTSTLSRWFVVLSTTGMLVRYMNKLKLFEKLVSFSCNIICREIQVDLSSSRLMRTDMKSLELFLLERVVHAIHLEFMVDWLKQTPWRGFISTWREAKAILVQILRLKHSCLGTTPRNPCSMKFQISCHCNLDLFLLTFLIILQSKIVTNKSVWNTSLKELILSWKYLRGFWFALSTVTFPVEL